MNPNPEKLTPKQKRVFAFIFLLIALVFGGIIGFAYWKGETVREARQRASLVKAELDQMARKEARERRKRQAKANAGRPAKKIKMVQIQRGTTGQASPYAGSGISPQAEEQWWIYDSTGAEIASSANPSGWGYALIFGGQSVQGSITVPANAPLGVCTTRYNYTLSGSWFAVNHTFEVTLAIPKIAQGATGTASLVDSFTGDAGAYCEAGHQYDGPKAAWWFGNRNATISEMLAPTPNSCAAAGYSISGATVSVPAGAPLGVKTYVIDTAPGTNNDPRDFPKYTFEVVPGTGGPTDPGDPNKCDKTVSFGPGVNGVVNNGANVLYHMEASVGSGVTDHDYPVTVVMHWGDGTQNTYNIVCTGGLTTSFDANHTYSDAGDYSVTFSAQIDDCTVQGPLGGYANYIRYFCEDGDCILNTINIGSTPHAGFMTCEEADCEATVGVVYWCVGGHVQSGTTPPAGVTTYPSEAACRAAGCSTTTPVFTRWRCNSSGVCESFTTTNESEGFTDCASAHCSGIVEPPVYTRFRCDGDGNCESFFTTNPLEGYEDCEHANCANNPAPGPCTYLDHSIANLTSTGDTALSLSLSRVGNPGWQLVVTHAIGGFPQSNPLIQTTPDAWNWTAPRTAGSHHFLAELRSDDCPDEVHVAEITLLVGGTGPTGDPFWCVDGVCVQAPSRPAGGAVTGPFASAGLCAAGCGGGGPCPPLPDPYTCSPTVAIQAPTASATLKNFALVRVQVNDPNEQTDPCHYNYSRPCNAEPTGPDLQLFLGEYHVSGLEWKHVSGSPLNGVWQTALDTRDYSNGTKSLKVSARGVGCCRVYNSASVTLSNTLQGNIFYRDTYAQVQAGYVVGDACIGVEVRALEENTSRRYWEQWGVRSGTTLDGAYHHADWDKHQPVFPVLGAMWEAQGQRFARKNYSAHVTFRLPLSCYVRFRRKWTPQFYLSTFDLNAQVVKKIRPIESGRHYVFTTTPARIWMYDGATIKVYGDFSVAPTIDEGELGDDEEPGDFDSLDRSGSNIYAPDAIDCAVLGGEATGDKVYVVVPPSSDNGNKGEVFAFDPDERQVALEYGIRKEARVPRFVEAVNDRAICLYVHDPGVSIPVASKRTRAYDLTFSTPTLLWQLADTATLASVDEGTLYVACGSKLYSTPGTTAPTLVNDFEHTITTATKTFVGLTNGEVWKATASGWKLVRTLSGPVGGATNWSAGTDGEPQTEAARGVVAGPGGWLSGEKSNGSWYDERQLRVPLDLATKTVVRVSALDHYSVDVAAVGGTGDAEQLPQKDERLLVGTAQSGLFFVYQKSLLSEAQGAIAVSHDTAPRVFPFARREVLMT